MGPEFQSREVRLSMRPVGLPAADCFELDTVRLRPQAGELVVRNLFCSVDPYMRGRMDDAPSYVAPFSLDRVLDGAAVGEVVWAPPDSAVEAGTLVLHGRGWREFACLRAETVRTISVLPEVSPSNYLGALGMPGLTAYVGLLDVGEMREGESVFVSGAAGAVGGMVGQIAKLHGAGLVVGSAGSDAKVDHLIHDLGYDAAFNYHSGPVRALLSEATKNQGIDLYFDNVGGEHLEAALIALRPQGRVAMCGAISQYNASEPVPGPRNLALVVGKRLRIQGFLVGDHSNRQPDFAKEIGAAVQDGLIKVDETVVDGIENMAEAFIGMLRGANVGKMVVRMLPKP